MTLTANSPNTYTYFVSYTGGNRSGKDFTGMSEIFLKYPIKRFSQIRQIAEFIEKRDSCFNVVITGFELLSSPKRVQPQPFKQKGYISSVGGAFRTRVGRGWGERFYEIHKGEKVILSTEDLSAQDTADIAALLNAIEKTLYDFDASIVDGAYPALISSQFISNVDTLLRTAFNAVVAKDEI